MDNKKQELIETAYRLIRNKGFDSFSYNDLSLEVGITKASIHYHYPNKEELGLALCDLISDRLDLIKSALDLLPGAWEKLNFYTQTIKGEQVNNLICPITSLQAEYNVVPASMQRKIKEISQKELAIAAEILQAGQDEKVFYFAGEAMDQAIILVASMKSAILYSRVLEKDLLEKVIDQFTKQLSNSVSNFQDKPELLM